MSTEKTAAYIEHALAETGIRTIRRCGGAGVIALVEGAEPGPCVGLRADIDALPVLERTNLPYRSRIDGAAHACGHDVHAACLLGAAKVLHDMRDTLRGSVKLIFQPAEELATGAAAMIADGALENPAMHSIFSLHVWPDMPAGTIGIRKGPVMASTQMIRITITGSQGHAAHPHQCIDSVMIAGHVICALQSVVSRELSPMEPGVLSLGKIRGGTAGNIIPGEVVLEGTVRSFTKDAAQQILDAARRVAEGTAAALRGSATLEIVTSLPPVVNEDAIYATMRATFEKTFGRDTVVDLPLPSMGGEDFALFLDHAPGGHFRLGSGLAKGPNPPLHSPEFMVDEACLSYGVAGLAALALEELGKNTA